MLDYKTEETDYLVGRDFIRIFRANRCCSSSLKFKRTQTSPSEIRSMIYELIRKSESYSKHFARISELLISRDAFVDVDRIRCVRWMYYNDCSTVYTRRVFDRYNRISRIFHIERRFFWSFFFFFNDRFYFPVWTESRFVEILGLSKFALDTTRAK